MLTIVVPDSEMYDERRQEFIYTKGRVIQMEHSLIAISRWESKWCKPFFDKKEQKTNEEVIDYIRCMTITQNVDPNIFYALSSENQKQIDEYINAKMTATTLPKEKGSNSREIVTSELIYYWMIALNIPMECQRWHINRLLTLIGVCNVKNSPGKKMSKREIMSRNAAVNAARRRQWNTKG